MKLFFLENLLVHYLDLLRWSLKLSVPHVLVRKTEYEQCTEYIMTMHAHSFSTSLLLQCFLLSLGVENLLTYRVARVRNTLKNKTSMYTVKHLGNLKIKPKKIALVDEFFWSRLLSHTHVCKEEDNWDYCIYY